MTTALEVVRDALEDLIVLASESPIEAPDSNAALRYLNDYVLDLEGNGIDLGWTVLTNLGESIAMSNVTKPTQCVRGLKANLAAELCAKFGVALSPELAARADSGHKTLAKLGITKPSALNYPPTLPVGSGNWDSSGWASHFGGDEVDSSVTTTTTEDETVDVEYADQYVATGLTFLLSSSYHDYTIYFNSSSDQTCTIDTLTTNVDGFRATIYKSGSGDPTIALPAVPSGITWGDGTTNDIKLTSAGVPFSLIYNYELNQINFSYVGAYDQD